MKKRVKKNIKIEINLTNRWLYFLISLLILLIFLIGVWAYSSNMNQGNPPVMGHSAGEIHVSDSSGNVMNLQQFIIDSKITHYDCQWLYDYSNYFKIYCPPGKYIVGIDTPNGYDSPQGIYCCRVMP
ncbi:MAG: hypothetical protein QXW97_03525 [Candidatus Pacearchaeota archaeon]